MTEQIFWIIIAAGLVTTLVLRLISKDKRPLRGTVMSLLPGIAALALINLTAPLTGVGLPVSRLSLSASALLGIPGVTAMLIIQALF
ncbi:MAG: pro-sigmaK processing inhibitor BofA family protein [Clostridia bacterium]|nr:pro-sigmaK processing inhibitor BofA family protein [Clostridia bacterium]